MTLKNIKLIVGLSTISAIKNSTVDVMCIGEASGISKGLQDVNAEGYQAPTGLQAVLADKVNSIVTEGSGETVCNVMNMRNEFNTFEIVLDTKLLEDAWNSDGEVAVKHLLNAGDANDDHSNSIYFENEDGEKTFKSWEKVYGSTFFADSIEDYLKKDDNDRYTLVNVSDEQLPTFEIINGITETNEEGKTTIVHGQLILNYRDTDDNDHANAMFEF